MAAEPPDAGSGSEQAGTPTLAIVVVNWHREQATIDCVRRLSCWQRLAPHVVVVDNNSGPTALALLERSLPDTQIIACSSNRGFGGANNMALEQSRADVVLLLNNDAVLPEPSAEQLLAVLDEQPRPAIVGPVLETSAPPHEVLSAGGRDLALFGRTHSTASERAGEIDAGVPFAVDYVPGTAVALRRRLFEQLAGFDERYFFSGEMADLCTRARLLGHQSLIVPTARARHEVALAGDLRELLYAYYSLRNRFLFIRLHATFKPWRLLLWSLRGTLRALMLLASGRPKHARSLALAVADGLRGRFGPANERVLP